MKAFLPSLLCFSAIFAAAAEDCLLETVKLPGGSTVEVRDVNGSTWVRMDGEPIVEVRSNRFLRFRSSPANDHWLGTREKPMDLGWDYHDNKAKGLVCTAREVHATAAGFTLIFNGEKPQARDVYQRNVVEAVWKPDIQGFEYTLTATLYGSLKSWRAVSTWACEGRAQPLDFHIERMSMLDRVVNNNYNGNLYHGLIYPGPDGRSTYLPKLGVPRTMLEGTYFYDFHLAQGQRFLLPDPKEGGWAVTVLEATGHPRIEVCWSWYDIHHILNEAIPLQSKTDHFESTYKLGFTRISAAFSREQLAAAAEVPWRNLPTYQLPVFQSINRFDRQFGGSDWTDPWFRTSYDCMWDRDTGFDEHGGSLRISRTNKKSGAAWYGVFTGRPYGFKDLAGKRCHVSARVNTQGCTGAVTIGVGQAFTWSTMYGVSIADVEPPSTWIRPAPLTGDNDWTDLSFECTAQAKGTDTWFFDLKGSGTAWCDNFIVEPIQ